MKTLKLTAALMAAALISGLAGCDSPADVASRNLSQAADQFEVTRRIIFMDTWNGQNLLEIDGLCSLGNTDKAREVTVTCKVGPSAYKKHFLGLGNNVAWFVEQVDPNPASIYHYQVLFRPETIVPDIRIN